MTIRDELERFLLPEKELSLKVVFDNVRNYLICGALLGMALWLQSGKATAPPFIFDGPPKDRWQLLIWCSLAAFFVLFISNAYQSYLIGRRMLRSIDPSATTATSSAVPVRRAWYFHASIFAVALALTLIGIAIILSLALLAIYISWFAAVGSRQ